MRSPLNEFAERIVRNEEVPEFILGLIIEMKVSPEEIKKAIEKAEEIKRKEIIFGEYHKYV